jgi:hypothetical protein
MKAMLVQRRSRAMTKRSSGLWNAAEVRLQDAERRTRRAGGHRMRRAAPDAAKGADSG